MTERLAGTVLGKRSKNTSDNKWGVRIGTSQRCRPKQKEEAKAAMRGGVADIIIIDVQFSPSDRSQNQAVHNNQE